MGSFINLKGSPGWTAAALAALGFPSKMPQIETEEFWVFHYLFLGERFVYILSLDPFWNRSKNISISTSPQVF